MINLGNLTQEQTIDLFKRCAAELPETVLFETLNEILTADQKFELREGWSDVE